MLSVIFWQQGKSRKLPEFLNSSIIVRIYPIKALDFLSTSCCQTAIFSIAIGWQNISNVNYYCNHLIQIYYIFYPRLSLEVACIHFPPNFYEFWKFNLIIAMACTNYHKLAQRLCEIKIMTTESITSKLITLYLSLVSGHSVL